MFWIHTGKPLKSQAFRYEFLEEKENETTGRCNDTGFNTMILADLGARVIKIENPGDPDYTRDFEPYLVDGDKRQSAFFAQYNRNKEAITLNLKEPRAKDIFRQMVQKADIVVENYRAGVMDKLGVGYENLKTYNPKLVYTAISGFGQTGPYSTWPAYDNSGQALSGLWSMNGMPGEPTRIGTIIGDLAATFFGAIGTLSAYIHAQKTGQGQLVDVAQLDASLALTENAVSNYTVGDQVQQPLGNDHPLCRPYGKFRAKDGEVFFGGYTDRFWKTTCEFFGEPELLQDPEIDTMAKRFENQSVVFCVYLSGAAGRAGGKITADSDSYDGSGAFRSAAESQGHVYRLCLWKCTRQAVRNTD